MLFFSFLLVYLRLYLQALFWHNFLKCINPELYLRGANVIPGTFSLIVCIRIMSCKSGNYHANQSSRISFCRSRVSMPGHYTSVPQDRLKEWMQRIGRTTKHQVWVHLPKASTVQAFTEFSKVIMATNLSRGSEAGSSDHTSVDGLCSC